MQGARRLENIYSGGFRGCSLGVNTAANAAAPPKPQDASMRRQTGGAPTPAPGKLAAVRQRLKLAW